MGRQCGVAVSAWWKLSAASAQKELKTRRCLSRLRSRALLECFDGWVQGASEQRESRAKMKKMYVQWQNRHAASAYRS